MKSIILPACLALALAQGAWAETFIVRPDQAGAVATIQEAVAAAEEGDVIELTDGVFRGEGNRDISFLGKGILIRSQSGDPGLCIIDCEGRSEDPHRAFIFECQEGTHAVLEGIGVMRGYAGGDGIETCGGGVLIGPFSSPTIRRCEISNCIAVYGGGVMCQGANPGFVDCTFRDNYAEWGGALYGMGWTQSLRIENCRFEGNACDMQGGAFHLTQGLAAQFEKCAFVDNASSFQGGAGVIYCNSYSSFDTCEFLFNSAPAGGALHMHDSGSVMRAEHCTFYGNQASFNGVIARLGVGEVSLRTSIIAASVGAEAVYGEFCAGLSVECCDIHGNEGGDWVGCIEHLLGINGNICEDPLLCDPSNGDYAIDAASPCAGGDGHLSACGRMGAYPVGCGTSMVTAHEAVAGFQFEPLVPNPAAGGPMKITYALPEAFGRCRVEVSVYDPAGRRVATLVDALQAPGTHVLQWDGRSRSEAEVSPGIYFVRIEAGGQRLTRRAVVSP
jgi:hypothetical protein